MGRKKSENPNKLDTEEFQKNVEQALSNRANVLAPPPFDVMDFYASMFSPQEWDAMQVLMASDHGRRLLFCSRTVDVDTNGQLFPNSSDRHVRVTVHLGKVWPNRDGVYWKNVAANYQQQIIEWAGDWQRYAQDTFAVCRAVKDLCEACETPGQVARLWPNIVQFLPEKNRDRLRVRLARSPLPLLATDGGRLTAKYGPERFARLEHIIAEISLLPAYDEGRPYMEHNHNERNNDPYGY